jgi:S1-C subfamily serine protease
LLTLSLSPLARGQGGLPADTLKALKAATVFLRVEGKFGSTSVNASGSGFVLKTDGDTVHIVTNFHVIRPPVRVRTESGQVEERRASAPITAVFGSGTKEERSVRAVFMAGDPQKDLALLKVSNLKDPPAPIAIETVAPYETMPVYVLGFPFGKALSFSKGNPAITIGKGTVSSLRLDEGGELAYVQIDGALNPGNSGGPVVDEKGRLVAIAVMTIKGSGIGVAIPAGQLTRLLKTAVGKPTFRVLEREGTSVRLQVQVPVSDPLAQLRSVALHYAPGVVRGKKRVSTLPEAKLVKLKVKGELAIGTVTLPLGEKGDAVPLTCQLEVVGQDGKPVVDRIYAGNLPLGKRAAPAVTTPRPPETTKPKPLSGEEVTAALSDLKGESARKRLAALRSLAGAEPDKEREDVAPAVKPLLADRNAITRQAAVQAYFTWAGKDALPACAERLKEEPDGGVRATLMDGLGKLGGAEAASAIAARLPILDDRAAAGKALKAIGPGAEKVVVPFLAHTNFQVRIAACRILEKVGTPESLAALRKATSGLPRGDSASAERALASVERAAEEAAAAIVARGKK